MADEIREAIALVPRGYSATFEPCASGWHVRLERAVLFGRAAGKHYEGIGLNPESAIRGALCMMPTRWRWLLG